MERQSITIENVFPATLKLLRVLISSYVHHRETIESERAYFQSESIDFPRINIPWGVRTFWRATREIKNINLQERIYNAVILTVSTISHLDELMEKQSQNVTFDLINTFAEQFANIIVFRANEANIDLSEIVDGIEHGIHAIAYGMSREQKSFHQSEEYINIATESNGFRLVCRIVAQVSREGQTFLRMVETINIIDEVLRMSMDMMTIKWVKDFIKGTPNVLLYVAMRESNKEKIRNLSIGDIRRAQRELCTVIQEYLQFIQTEIEIKNLRTFATIQFAESVLKQILSISGIVYPLKHLETISSPLDRTEM